MKAIKNAVIMSDLDLEGNEKGLNFTFNIFNIEDAADNDFTACYIDVAVWHHRNSITSSSPPEPYAVI